MPEVITSPTAAGQPHRLAAPQPHLDAVTQRLMDDEVAKSAERAYATGFVEGRAAGRQEIEQLAATIGSQLSAVHRDLLSLRTQAVDVHLDVAVQLAATVLDASPPPPAVVTVGRIRDALTVVDGAITIAVSPDDAAEITNLLRSDGHDITVDPSLTAGEARVTGPHGGALLTRPQLLAAARDVAAASGDRPPVADDGESEATA